MRTTFLKMCLIIPVLAVTMVKSYDFSGHSFFSVRAPFQTASPEKEALWHYDWLNAQDEECLAGSFEVVPFGGKSIGRGLGHYFGLHKNRALAVVEYKPNVTSTDLIEEKNIEARHFNIVTRSTTHAFRSNIKIAPTHSFFGVGLAYRQRVAPCWWIEASAPIMRVSNRIRVSEKILDDGGGASEELGLDGALHFDSMKKALQNHHWKYGRIDSHRHDKWGIADIELKCGHDGYTSDTAHLRSYVGVVIPTGNKSDPRYCFAPVVGNNHHFGVMFGSNLDFELWCHGNHVLTQEIDTCGKYLFPNHQTRSFDLKDKQFGRYMEVYENLAQAQRAFAGDNRDSGTSGINVFTQRVKVDPRFSVTFNTAARYFYCDAFLAEFGYNFFARQGEKVDLRLKHTDVSLKHVDGRGQTTESRTIRNNYERDGISIDDYRPITIKDIDKSSAAHPPAISQILYGSIGYQCNRLCCPMLFSLGGSYEFSHSNGGLKRWMIWAKAGISF